MPFATPAELATYLQRTFSPSEESSAEQAIAIATEVVRDRARQHFSLVENDVLTLNSYPGEDINLPQRPVNAVLLITTRARGTSTTLTPTAFADYEVHGGRLRWVGLDSWPYEVTVTYTHGYSQIPADVLGATLAVAAELFTNPEALASSAIDDSTDRHEWSDDSPAERMLKMIERRYDPKPISVRVR